MKENGIRRRKRIEMMRVDNESEETKQQRQQPQKRLK
jgi:hypothetical protein